MTDPKFRFGTAGRPISTPKKPSGSPGVIKYLASQHLRALEINWVRSVRVSPATCQKIKETARRHDVALSIHAPYYINLNANEEEWPKSRKRLMDAATYGHLAGATDIVFHPGSYFGQAAAEVLRTALPRLAGCIEELRAQDNPVTLRPETMGKGSLLGSLQDVLALSSQIDGVEPCLDFSHLHARAGDGSINSFREWSGILETYADTLGADALQRLHCHLSGIAYSSKGEQKHLMLDDSDMEYEALLRALVVFDCGGRILCESPEYMDKDALLIQKTVQRLREEIG